MPKSKLPLPMRGANNATPYIEAAGDTAPNESLLNVRPRRKGGGRRQIGSRPGWRKLFSFLATLPQACGVVSKASGISGFQAGQSTPLDTGYTNTIGFYRTQCVVLDKDRSVLRTFNDTRATPAFANPAGGPGGPGGFYCCWHSTDNDIGYFGTLTKDTGVTTTAVFSCGLNRIRISDGTITHQAYVVDADPGYATPVASTDMFPNVIRQHGPYLYVAVRQYIYVFSAADLTYLGRTAVPWAVEVQDIRVKEFGGRHFVLALYSGSVAITGPVVTDTGAPAGERESFGEHFRSGVHLFCPVYAETVAVLGNPPVAFSAWSALTWPTAAAATAVAPGQTTLFSLSLITGRQVADPFYEAHQAYRLSEWSLSRSAGIGRIPYSFAVDSNMAAFIGTANQGFGPDPITNATQRPNGPANVNDNNPYITIGKHVLTRAFESDSPAIAWTSQIMTPGGSAIRYGCGVEVGGWERDVDRGSYRRTYVWDSGSGWGGTFRTDIPPINSGFRDPANEDYAPTAYAVALHEEYNRVIVAGRRPATNQDRPNVFCMRASDGVHQWSAYVTGLVQQHCVAIDPNSGNVLVGFNRNQNGVWAVASPGTWAEVAEFDIQSGDLVRVWDFSAAVNVNGYITAAYGTCGCYALDVNSDGHVLAALAPYRYDN